MPKFGEMPAGAHPLKLVAPEGRPEVLIERLFNATPENIWRAFTDPEVVKEWWGPPGLAMTVIAHENKIGGRWEYEHKDDKGNVFGFKGVVHDVVENEYSVRTFEFSGFPRHVLLESMTLEAQGDKTLLKVRTTYQTQGDRDGMVAGGMEEGQAWSYKRLDDWLAANA